MNFAQLYHNLLNNSNKFINKKNKNFLKETIKLIKSDKILKEEYKLYSNISNLEYENDVITTGKFVNECNKFLSNKFDKKSINESNNKLENFLKANKIKLDESIEYDNRKLHESIDLFLNDKNDYSNILNTVDLLKENSQKNKSNSILKEHNINLPSEYVIPMMIREFNNKYEKVLSENHKKLVSIIIENKEESKSKYYKELINECLVIINEAIKKNNDTDNDITIKNDLLNTKEKLLNTTYINESFITDSEDIIELIETLKE